MGPRRFFDPAVWFAPERRDNLFCQEYWAERGLKTAIARFHNVYGPHGTWDGGREKAPAALSRKVIEAKDTEMPVAQRFSVDRGMDGEANG